MFTASIRGKTYRCLLDTAASAGMVSSRLIKDLSLKPTGTGQANDSAKKPNVEVLVYRLEGLVVGRETFNNVLVTADPNGKDSGPLKDIDAILPLNAFGDKEVTMDFPGKRLLIGADKHLIAALSHAQGYKDDHGCPVLQMKLGSIVSDVRLDSGSEMGLTMPNSFLPRLHMIGEKKFVGMARTMFRSFDLYQIHVSDRLEIGGQVFVSPTILLNDIFPLPNLGSKSMAGYCICIDQKHHRILFSKPS